MHGIEPFEREVKKPERASAEGRRHHHAARFRAREGARGVGSRAVHIAPRGAYQCTHAKGKDALRLLVGLESEVDPLLGVPLRFIPASRQELRPAKLGEYPRHRALLATFLGLLEKRPEELDRAPELVNPGQYDGQGEGRADGGLNRVRAFLELTSARNRRSPFVSARHRVDEGDLA